MPWDNVDKDFLDRPRTWDADSIGRFMRWIGPTSSVFDLCTFIIMFFIVCPAVLGGSYAELPPKGQEAFAALFHAGWFVESLWTQTFVLHLLRTPHKPFLQSRMAWPVVLTTTGMVLLGTLLPYTELGAALDFLPLP